MAGRAVKGRRGFGDFGGTVGGRGASAPADVGGGEPRGMASGAVGGRKVSAPADVGGGEPRGMASGAVVGRIWPSFEAPFCMLTTICGERHLW